MSESIARPPRPNEIQETQARLLAIYLALPLTERRQKREAVKLRQKVLLDRVWNPNDEVETP